MNIKQDKRIVMTLDAGGTNFVFSAMQGGQEIIQPIQVPANGDNLELCLDSMRNGFEIAQKNLKEKPVAISFAFPGPADYPQGIIGDLGNLPAFRGGVPLKAILEKHFQLPVFINNDGDLFAYGEALGGILPVINQRLAQAGSPKRYRNLVGLTLGTGFGAGIVRNEELFIGDNSIAAEVWLTSNRYDKEANAEELVSIRAVQRAYADTAKVNWQDYSPKDIYQIATGQKAGHKEAARDAYAQVGQHIGDSLANLLTLIDGIAVIGGGITGASELYMPAVMHELQSQFTTKTGEKLNRMVQQVYNLDQADQWENFVANRAKTIPIPGTEETLQYESEPRLAVATSQLGASKAIAIGAYAFALKKLSE